MNIGLIIAGGSGNRMGQDIPKQFMHVDGAPIIIHTMQCFQQHPDIGMIAVVCLKGWETVLQSYANQFKRATAGTDEPMTFKAEIGTPCPENGQTVIIITRMK